MMNNCIKNFMGVGLCAILISNCSVTGGVKPVATSTSEFDGAFYQGETTILNQTSLGGEEFRIFNQGSTGFVSLQANREDAEARASKYCNQKGKVFRPLRETVSKSPHVLGNFPRVELIFECIEQNAISNTELSTVNKYNDLKTIKYLLDNGILTKDEFELEKQKILNKK